VIIIIDTVRRRENRGNTERRKIFGEQQQNKAGRSEKGRKWGDQKANEVNDRNRRKAYYLVAQSPSTSVGKGTPLPVLQ
jgi:hypothetical protein